MRRSASLGLVLALVLAAAPAFAGQRVALKDGLSVPGAEVRLGDLFEDAGAASGVIVARATGPTLILDAARVQAIAAANGLVWRNPNGYRELVVKTGFAAPAPAAAAPAAMTAAETVRAPAPPAERMVEALTWAHDLSAGDVVRPEDVIWAKVPARLVPHDAERDPDAAVGQAARRGSRPGAAPGDPARSGRGGGVPAGRDPSRADRAGSGRRGRGRSGVGAERPVQEDHRRGRVRARPGGHRARRPSSPTNCLAVLL
jgi:flagella basal body P-ring formation protein FlgA